MRRIRLIAVLLGTVLSLLFVAAATTRSASNEEQGGYEVWVIDQADTTPNGGGTLYIYRGDSLTGGSGRAAAPEVIDLGGAASALCQAQTGSAPRRPHMLSVNSDQTHVVIAFVATGHVLFMEGAGRTPVACIDAGEQAHAAIVAPNQRYVVVANQNGKKLQRIRADFAANHFTLESAATIDLVTCTTPSGAACEAMGVRPDNAPICPMIEHSSRWTLVTLRGGGLFVVDAMTTPMQIVADYDRTMVQPNGCGGVQFGGKMYINSGGGTPATPLRSELYAFPLNAFSAIANVPNTPEPEVVFSHTARGFVDSHGAALIPGRNVIWVNDRAANRIILVDATTDTVVNEIVLTGALSSDPAPDLIEVSPDGNWAFITLRGPGPLTGNAMNFDNAVGKSPGLGVLRVNPDGRGGELVAIAPINRMVEGLERADPHGIAVRRR